MVILMRRNVLERKDVRSPTKKIMDQNQRLLVLNPIDTKGMEVCTTFPIKMYSYVQVGVGNISLVGNICKIQIFARSKAFAAVDECIL